MSIFSNKGSYCNLNDYSYFKTDNDINIYYIGSIYVNDNKNVSISIFIDENKKILFDSKYYFYMFDRLINSLNMILNVVNNIVSRFIILYNRCICNIIKITYLT